MHCTTAAWHTQMATSGRRLLCWSCAPAAAGPPGPPDVYGVAVHDREGGKENAHALLHKRTRETVTMPATSIKRRAPPRLWPHDPPRKALRSNTGAGEESTCTY